jgi:hypothetical protein
MVDKTEHGLISTGNRKYPPQYDECLEFVRDCNNLQWGSNGTTLIGYKNKKKIYAL